MNNKNSQGSDVRSPQRSGFSDVIGLRQQGTGTPAGSRKESPESGKKPSMPLKKRILTILVYVFVSVFGLSIGGGIYGMQILGNVGFAAVPFVGSDDYKPKDIGTLDNLDAEGTGADTTSSWAKGGHTKVFVDPDFPIKKVAQKDKNVENILVFGVDSRGTTDVHCRADAVMIVSLDNNTKTLKLISLMRDCGVTIEGRTNIDKLTHSYAYGGVGLLINTINGNFGLDVQRFVMLDFSSSSDIIDLVGGVNIDVQAKEVKYANQSINEENMLLGTNVPLLTYAGNQTLNGVQAIAWSRIRHADSDFVRTSRQRTVASALMKKVSSMNKLAQLALLKDSAGIFQTNMTQSDMLRLGTVAVGLIKNMVEYRIPDDGLFTIQESPWLMKINWEKQIPKLHEYIWGTSDI